MRALVTGAGGFIGSHLAEALVRAGADVRAFVRYNSRNHHGWLEAAEPEVRREIEVFAGDLTNPEAVSRAAEGCEAIFHLGALIPIPYSFVHPREFVAANVEGTLNVLEAARRAGVPRVVHTSTSEVYGSAQHVPIDEGHPLRPQSPYAATKVAADQLALSFHRSFGLPVVVARPFNTYGPRQSGRAVVPTIAAQALAREAVELGALHPTRDFLYVEDTVAGLVRCAEVDGIEGRTFNLGTGVEVSIKELADRILVALGVEAAVETVPERLRPGDAEVERLVADVGKARRELGWEAAVGLDDGLQTTLEWVRENLGAYKPELYNL